MNNFRLIVDSSCDLPEDFYSKYSIGVADLIVNFNGQLYLDRKEITASEIIEKYDATKVYPKTAALNLSETEEIFKRELKTYDHIFYMPISSKISSNFNNARLAAQDIGAEDKITVLDSASLSSGTGLEAIGISEDILAGYSPADIEKRHNERVKYVDMSFVIQTLDFLHEGGRCGGLTYFLGNRFNIHPIVRLDDGKMGVHAIVRGKDLTKGIKKMEDEFFEAFDADNIDFSYPILIPHVTGDYAVKKLHHDLEEKVGSKILYPVEASGIICCHCGRDTVGLAYMLKHPLAK